ncbi:putative acrylyl-CoA reductase AcuI [Caulifigura coniformis]|uniref:Putative acrylyl-CoA reductase AcuI n=1 Tax=Caulifigura coniformis TaxID=2527983 RepID=A0A517SMM2_9PLAN|nr:putative acrylyl-CoA reductase AcuI [Caulifigura coniformis]
MRPESFRCYFVEQVGQEIHGSVQERPFVELPADDVLIRVSHSSLNYKDAMAASGHRGIVKTFPHVPGIDAAGVVVESTDPAFLPGDEVIATGREIGVERWGAWSEYLRAPAAWVQHVPEGLTPFETMVLGTAGFTAAQCVAALLEHGVTPDQGEIVVTGATGGVGSLAIRILARLGYNVAAVSGKESQANWLRKQGASRVIPRSDFVDSGSRPLLNAAWAGGVDTVGGPALATMIRATHHRGCVAACGVVGGAELPLTVYPFILRGVTLAGIDSAWCPDHRRTEIWRRLGHEWKIDGLEAMAVEVPLDKVGDAVQAMLAGHALGRTVVSLQ